MMSTLTRLTLIASAATLPLLAGIATAAPMKSMPQSPTSKVDMSVTKASLELPLIERLQDLRAQGDGGYQNLVKLMFDRQANMQTRWKAVTSAGRVGGPKSAPELTKAMKSDEWYMRNAALIAMMQLDRPTGLAWARRLMNDKALVVRAAAVDAISQARDATSAPLLWEKLYSKENFKSGQSLFIRRRIVETLAQMESKGRESKFVAVLADKDETLHAPAIAALERITNKTMGQPNEPLKFRKAKWEKWWKSSRTL